MRVALLVLALTFAGLAAASPASAFNACLGTTDGAVHACAYADWEDPALCWQVDLQAGNGNGDTGTCVHG